ncbi:hypothetical protein [Sphingobacterium sp. E70]|uniref:hypothetical protein n=1 Tax=Sphingobacterium sp. E70 TaxID=2853439 RepID=UPI00211C2A8A|nr:hypothetical protein [Sphingobacterium sp. E70]
MTTNSFSTDRYLLTPDWQRRFWTVVYVDTAPQLKSIMDNTESGTGKRHSRILCGYMPFTA